MPQYLDAQELKAELTKSAEQPTDRLVELFYCLANHLCLRYFNLKTHHEDAVQEIVLTYFDKYQNADLSRPPSSLFAYFTTIGFNHLNQIFRGTRNYQKMLSRLHIHQQEKQRLDRSDRRRHHNKHWGIYYSTAGESNGEAQDDKAKGKTDSEARRRNDGNTRRRRQQDTNH